MTTTYAEAEEKTLRMLIRRVDKHLVYDVRPAPDPDWIILSLKQGKVSTDLQLRISAIQEAEESLTNLESLRVRIKRARDAMWNSVGRIPLQSNRVQRPTPGESSYFLPRRRT